MQLTQFTDLGLRIVMRLAADRPGTAAPSTRAVADQLAVSYTHATKVVARLSDLGVVTTRRGRGGGLAVTELGRTVSVGWLTRQLEGDGEVVTCEGDKPCPLRQGCRLRSALRDAQEAFYTALDTMTVQDLTTPTTVLPTPTAPAVTEP